MGSIHRNSQHHVHLWWGSPCCRSHLHLSTKLSMEKLSACRRLLLDIWDGQRKKLATLVNNNMSSLFHHSFCRLSGCLSSRCFRSFWTCWILTSYQGSWHSMGRSVWSLVVLLTPPIASSIFCYCRRDPESSSDWVREIHWKLSKFVQKHDKFA